MSNLESQTANVVTFGEIFHRFHTDHARPLKVFFHVAEGNMWRWSAQHNWAPAAECLKPDA